MHPSSAPPRPNRTKTVEIPTSVNEALAEIRELRRGLNRIDDSLDVHVDDHEWRDRALKARKHLERRARFLTEWLVQGDDVHLLAAAFAIVEKLHEDMEGGLMGDELRVLNRLRNRFPVAHNA